MLIEYERIMKAEIKIRNSPCTDNYVDIFSPLEVIGNQIYDALWQIFEVAKSAFVSRSYNTRYNLCEDDTVFESVSAHTNLVLAIASSAFSIFDSSWVYDKYCYKDIEEAIRLHDLSENEIGDIPDNENRDDDEKNRLEMEYYKKYAKRFSSKTRSANVLKLLGEMQQKSSFTGRMIYLSDKVAALIITLCLDEMGHSPMIDLASPHASDRDRAEMRLCDDSKDGMYYASEMWTMDFFEMRKLNQYDDTMFFTALVVLATLRVRGRWYNWREKSYQN